MKERASSRVFRMTFGKYAGVAYEDLPTSYIEWLLGNLNSLSKDAIEELENQLRARRGEGIAR